MKEKSVPMEPRRIFLDVGANTGQTLAAALDPVFRFDWIVCFEPAPACWPRLKQLADARVKIERFGLWNQTCEKPLFDPGGKGASLWHKDNFKPNITTEVCQFRQARYWFEENLKVGDIVFLKLNCEGAECDILDDLLDSGEFDKVTFAMVDFDVRKISSQKHREAELRDKLAAFPFPRVAFTKEVMIGKTHQARIKYWLGMTGANL